MFQSSCLALDRYVVLLGPAEIPPQPQRRSFSQLQPRAVVLVEVRQQLDPPQLSLHLLRRDRKLLRYRGQMWRLEAKMAS